MICKKLCKNCNSKYYDSFIDKERHFFLLKKHSKSIVVCKKKQINNKKC